MKRDLKKWLLSQPIKDFVEYNNDDISVKKLDSIQNPLDMLNLLMDSEAPKDEIVEFIWCQAQKQFLKDLLDDLDKSIARTWKDKNEVRNSDAQFVAYETSVKNWLYNKYHYLKRKNHG